MVPLCDSVWHKVGPCSDDDTTTCHTNRSKGQVFFELDTRIDVTLYLGYAGRILQVQLLVFFVRANQGQGDVGYCGDVALLTSASKGNWRMMTASSSSTPPLDDSSAIGGDDAEVAMVELFEMTALNGTARPCRNEHHGLD